MIGIGISTRNRHETFVKSYIEILNNTPYTAKIVVVDDASDIEPPFTTYRFEKNVGVAVAKNKCLELLEGCEHIFLFDNDTYPLTPEWWIPYVDSDEPHLMYQFKIPGKPKSDMRLLHEDENIKAYSNTRGAMIYLHRSAINTVGGFDNEYGTFFEHPDLTNRIYNAGLTTHRAMDVVGSEKLLYCLDQDGAIESSIPDDVRQRNMAKNYRLYSKNKLSKAYKEYR